MHKEKPNSLIAQDLDAATESTGVEFGGIDKSDPNSLGLNYAETNAILWQGMREMSAKITMLMEALLALVILIFAMLGWIVYGERRFRMARIS